jgi:ATP-dependent Clp protease protease subunit
MKNTNGPDVIVLPDDKDNSIRSFKQIIPVTVHHFYITDEIAEPDKYLELINTLKTSEQHDTIFMYLNTPGGYLNTAIQIMSAMKQSNATVITSIEGEVCSAGTLIFLSGDKYIINPNSTFMIHNYSAWIGGKGNEIAAHAKYREEYAKELMNDVYKDFLTEDEIQSVLDGKDIWLSSNSVIKRLSAKEKVLGEEVDVQGALNKLPQLLTKLLEEENTAATMPATPDTPAPPPEKKAKKAAKKAAKKKPLK